MRRAWIIVMAGAIAVAGGSLMMARGGEAGDSASGRPEKARAALVNASGVEIGTVKLEQDGDGVELNVKVLGGVTAGFHGLHIHTTGVCATPFTSAGGHYNPGGAAHRDHAGDLPVLYIDEDGEANARFSSDRFALADLFDADGSAFILHANADNYANIPTDRYAPDPDATTLATGDAGARIACGVIERK